MIRAAVVVVVVVVVIIIQIPIAIIMTTVIKTIICIQISATEIQNILTIPIVTLLIVINTSYNHNTN